LGIKLYPILYNLLRLKSSGKWNKESGVRSVRTYTRRGACGAGFMFFIWERFAGIRKTRRLESKTGSASSRAFADSEMTSRNMAATRLDRRRAAETCAEQVLRPPAEIQARIGHRTRVWEARNKTASSRTCSDSDPCAYRTEKNENRQGRTRKFTLTAVCFT